MRHNHHYHYRLKGRDTEMLLLDGRAFSASPAIISFSAGENSDPSDMIGNAVFVDVVIGCETKKSMVPMIEFCVAHGSESEKNLMAAAASQGHGFKCLMYVKHANGECYSFNAGRFTTANYGGRICAVFRDVKKIHPEVYASIRGPIQTEGQQHSKVAQYFPEIA